MVGLKILFLTVKNVIARHGIIGWRGDNAEVFRQRLMRMLAILGASGHGKVVADTALHAGWDEVLFF